jgi:non-specific serine/threonine protein kinase
LLVESLALDRETDNQHGLASGLELSARLAAARGRSPRAVELYARAGLLRDTTGAQAHEIWWKVWWPDAAPHIAELRSKIGDAEFEQAWERGRAMTVNEAIDAALQVALPPEQAHMA